MSQIWTPARWYRFMVSLQTWDIQSECKSNWLTAVVVMELSELNNLRKCKENASYICFL